MSIIHDLGYKRYIGTRRSAGTRWRVVARHQLSMGWKKWWRWKLALGFAFITLAVAAGLLFFATGDTMRSFGSRGGQNIAMTFADGVVPLSISHFCRAAFILSLTLGAGIIASDTQSGAFTFYYVRSIRPRDYVLGKLAGYGLQVATIVIIGPLVLAGMRLGFSASTEELVEHLDILPKVIGVGLLATLAYTTVPLAISALIPNRRYALAMWAAYYIVIGNIMTVIATKVSSNLAIVDLQATLQSITFQLFDVQVLRGRFAEVPLTIAIVGILAQSALAIAIVWFQVSRDHRSGVGGSS
jgi:hypothetical protein